MRDIHGLRFRAALFGTLVFVVGVGGCGGRAPLDTAAEQARLAERDGRAHLRGGSTLAFCDASLLFARARHLGGQSADRRWANRGEALVARYAPHCEQQIRRFWARYRGCASPIQGRELETFAHWDGARIAAFQQYGLPGIASAMSAGRNGWAQSCPADYQVVTAQEGTLRAQAPLPVPIAAVAAPERAESQQQGSQPLHQAVAFMANGQYEQALAALQAARAAGGSPIITFNVAVCLDQLDRHEEAVTAYRQVSADPTFGPRAQARIAFLTDEAPLPPSEDQNQTARAEFERGLAFAEAGSFEEAIQAFNHSYAAVPHPRTVLNIAISYHRLHQIDAALSHYQLVVDDERLEATMRESARRAIEELTAGTTESTTVAGTPSEP